MLVQKVTNLAVKVGPCIGVDDAREPVEYVSGGFLVQGACTFLICLWRLRRHYWRRLRCSLLTQPLPLLPLLCGMAWQQPLQRWRLPRQHSIPASHLRHQLGRFLAETRRQQEQGAPRQDLNCSSSRRK